MMKRVNRLKEIYKTIDSGTAESKMHNLPKFPKIIEFEITNHCNFNCLMCETGLGTTIRERGYMSEEIFHLVLDEIKDYPIALKFVGQGESMLHPKAVEFIRIAKEHGVITHLTTNGSLLNRENICGLIDAGLDSIKFSFQGIDPDGYMQLRQKDNFDDLINTIRLFYDLRGEKETPYMTIGTSVTNETKECIDAFIREGEQICDKVEVGITSFEFANMEKIKNNDYKEKLMRLFGQQKIEKKRYICCPQIFDTITVRWNGDVTSCCGDLDGIMTLGNVQKTKIKDLWICDKQKFYRSILSKNQYDSLELCSKCYDIYGWTYGDN